MNLDFESVLSHTLLEHEGGYANDPNDSGGETFAGVSRVNNPTWAGWPLVDRVKAQHKGTNKKALTRFIDNELLNDPEMLSLLTAVYYSKYWKPMESLQPLRTRAKVFDTGVNTGPAKAIKILQNAVGTAQDGILGPKTQTAVLAINEDVLLGKYSMLQASYYKYLAEKYPKKKRYLTSWLRRAAWIPK